MVRDPEGPWQTGMRRGLLKRPITGTIIMLQRAHAHTATPTTILCVEDDPYVTDLLHYALERAGYRVIVAEDGATALRLIHRDPPDVVLLDLRLPDRDGLNVCAQIQRIGRIPVIVLTARDSDLAIANGYRHGAADYIAKPFRMQILLSRIQEVLQRSRSLQDDGPALRMQNGP